MLTGSLRLADLGFYHMDVLHQIHTAGSFWIARVPTNTLIAYPGRAPNPCSPC